MNAEERTPEWYLVHLRRESELFAAAIDAGPHDAPVPSCPGWDVARLTLHLGVIHRWARHCALFADPPDDRTQFEPSDRDLAEWFREGAADLVTTLAEIDHDGPTWHPFTVTRVGRVWPRRQAHETAMHRWDIESAVGEPGPLDAELASDGIDEYFELALPRLLTREGIALPAGSFHVHCTDVEGEWIAWNADGELHLEREHRKGDAALRGPAEAVLLRLWNRVDDSNPELSSVGDEAVRTAWLSLGGM